MSSPPLPEWRQRSERGTPGLLRFMVRLSLLVGRRLSRVVLHAITLYFVCFAPRTREASRAYLRRALGREPGWRDRYRHVLAFASTVHDRIYLLNDRFDLFDIEVQGADALLQAVQQGGLLLVGAHLGSFDALRCVGRQHPGLQIGMLMYEDNARQVAAALQAINPQARHDVVPLGRPDSMIEAARRIEQGHLLGMLADRSIHGDDERVMIDFLGAPAGFAKAPWRLALVLRRPVFFMAGLYLGGNRYRLVFEPLADFGTVDRGERDAALAKAQVAYAQRLEACCRQAPYNWFNFFDFWRP